MRLRVLILGLACLIYGNAVARADVITFDTIPAEGRNLTEFGTLEVTGFVFTSPHAHVVT